MKTALEFVVLCSIRRQNRGGRTAESASPWCFLALTPRLTHGRAGTCEDTMIDPILSHLRLSGRTTLECRAPESHTAAPDVCQRHKARHGLARITRHLDHHQLLVVTRGYWPSSGSTREPYKDGVFPGATHVGALLWAPCVFCTSMDEVWRTLFEGGTLCRVDQSGHMLVPSTEHRVYLHLSEWSVEDPYWGWNSRSGRPGCMGIYYWCPPLNLVFSTLGEVEWPIWYFSPIRTRLVNRKRDSSVFHQDETG